MVQAIFHALAMAFAMGWQILWALILGFTLSALAGEWAGGRGIAIVAGDLVGEEHILEPRAPADIVNHQRPALHLAITHEPYMRMAPGQPPGHDVAGLIVARGAGDGQLLAVAGEEHGEIGHPSMIDVGIGLRQAPELRVRGKGALHVLMDEELQIDAAMPIGADDNVAAYAAIARHVATGKGEKPVARIVNEGDAYLGVRALEEALDGRGRLLRVGWRGEHQEENKH